MTLWEILGVNRGCSSLELATAFRAKCKELHPDVTGNNEKKTKIFISMKTAYEKILKNRELFGIENPQEKQTVYSSMSSEKTFSTNVWKSVFSTQDLYQVFEEMQAAGFIQKQSFEDFKKKNTKFNGIFKTETTNL